LSEITSSEMTQVSTQCRTDDVIGTKHTYLYVCGTKLAWA